ncbi:ferredoxin [Candidatus Acetothermia bacterium]|nr:MAG: ferredoxin [Candidatus Acetothermia bacterium]HHK67271.1 ferredoxin [Candidatus Acetothermia bacterium]
MANPTVDKDLCVGCALCTQVCSDVFEMGADGKAEVKDGADLNAACIQDAVDQCPVGAISA